MKAAIGVALAALAATAASAQMTNTGNPGPINVQNANPVFATYPPPNPYYIQELYFTGRGDCERFEVIYSVDQFYADWWDILQQCTRESDGYYHLTVQQTVL